MVRTIGLLLVLISSISYAQWPSSNCTLGPQDFRLESSPPECGRCTGPFCSGRPHGQCPPGYHLENAGCETDADCPVDMHCGYCNDNIDCPSDYSCVTVIP